MEFLTLLCYHSSVVTVMKKRVIPFDLLSKKAAEDIQLSISFTVQTEDNPRVAQVSITKCSSDMNGYCLHGQCIYLVDMSENYCRCEVGYTGVRCEHFFLTVQQPLSKEYVALTVILVILFLIIVAGSIYYFCRWYRNRKSKEPKKEYERVSSRGPALPQV
uniref:Proepiregulin n=1 Tax=Sus scrofa TaxID=9823 RepID=A0A8D1TWJ7_PIG